MFLNLTFRPFHLNDRPFFERLLAAYPPPLALYTFSALAAWQQKYQRKWCLLRDDLILISAVAENQTHLLQPIGNFHKADEQMLIENSQTLPYPLKMMGVSDPFLLKHPHFCANFHAMLNSERGEYLYRTADLVNLVGSDYEKKRNLIAQAKEHYTWQVCSMAKEHHCQCPHILASVGQRQRNPEIALELEQELVALGFSLNHFAELNLKGLVIIINERPVAFSIFEMLNQNTAVVHFEKADIAYKGLYQVINQETAKAIQACGFTYINREEDLGLPGLKRAKLSYSPIAVLSNYTLTLKSVP